MRVTKAIINLDNLAYNIKQIRNRIGGEKKICLAVKADGYGHGSFEISKKGIECGADYLGVAAVGEGIYLREKGIKAPVLLFSLCSVSEIKELFQYDIIPFVADITFIREIEKYAESKGVVKNVHLKIDTGMNRVGCRPDESLDIAEYIDRSKNLKLGGICTHFPVSDTMERDFTENQIKSFKNAVEKIKNANIDTGIIHASNSGGIIQYPDAYFDMVRPGIILYGYSPDRSIEKKIDLKPVMSFESEILFIKKIKKGEGVSYGLTWKAEKDTWIGTIPAGYADGVNRLLSSRGSILIRDKLYPVAGRVCMDQFMVDLGPEIKCERYDKAVIFGYDNKGNGADDIADICSTIPYEILCNINKRVERVYI